MAGIRKSRVVLVGALAALSAACGSTEKPTRDEPEATGGSGGGTPATHGGKATSGGASAIGGVSAMGGAGAGAVGGSSSLATVQEVCVALVRAACNKRNECAGRATVEDPCPWTTDRCPDLYTSPGSTITLANLQACAERYATYTCDAYYRHEDAGCEFPSGVRELGEACAFRTQCASGYCRIESEGEVPCGTCAQPLDLDEGEPCTFFEDCRSGLECAAGVCTPRAPYAPPGAACEIYGLCQGSNFCVQLPSDAAKSCQPLPPAGQPCPLEVARCGPGAYCNENGMCQASPAAGEPCALNPDYLNPCAEGLVCVARQDEAATCGPRRLAGETCTPQPQISDPQANCTEGHECVCDDATCATGLCYDRRFAGEACGAATELCVPGTTCEGGTCRPVEGGQGLFDAHCGP